jgi:hypothetical protein
MLAKLLCCISGAVAYQPRLLNHLENSARGFQRQQKQLQLCAAARTVTLCTDPGHIFTTLLPSLFIVRTVCLQYKAGTGQDVCEDDVCRKAILQQVWEALLLLLLLLLLVLVLLLLLLLLLLAAARCKT